MSGDPYWGKVSLLVPMNGVDEETTFADVSSYARTVTAYGGAKTDDAQSIYGGSSGYFDGTDDYLQLGSLTGLSFTGDFTLEWWDYPNSVTGYRPIIDFRPAATLSSYICGIWDGKLDFICDGVELTTTTTTISTGAWKHRAFTRQGSTLMAFSDGIKDATTATKAGTITPSTNAYIGRNIDGSYFSGWLYGLRFTNFCRYSADFTPPAAAFDSFPPPNPSSAIITPNRQPFNPSIFNG